MINALTRFLGSIRLTLVLILLLGLMFLAGLWIPQKKVVQQAVYQQWQERSPQIVAVLDKVGLTEIYSSPIMQLLWCLFFANLAIVMAKRVPLLRKKVSLDETRIADPESAPGYNNLGCYPIPRDVAACGLLAAFRQQGYLCIGTDERFYAVRNRLSPAASLLFHLSFFMMLIGAAVSVYSKFTGYLDLAVGESFSGKLEQFNGSPLIPKIGSSPANRITVTRISPLVVRNTATGLEVEIRDEQGGIHTADVNRPYKVGNTSFVVSDLGVAPLFVLLDENGHELDGAFAKLDVMKGKTDSFILGDYRFKARFLPDYQLVDGEATTLSEEFNRPAFVLDIDRKAGPVARRTILPGGSVEFDGKRLELREMPFWVRFFVVKESGVEILYAAFALAILALVWRLIYYRRELVAKVITEEGRSILHLAGKAEFFRALSEDEFHETIDKILGKMDAELKNEATSGKGDDR